MISTPKLASVVVLLLLAHAAPRATAQTAASAPAAVHGQAVILLDG